MIETVDGRKINITKISEDETVVPGRGGGRNGILELRWTLQVSKYASGNDQTHIANEIVTIRFGQFVHTYSTAAPGVLVAG
jgi:hypothetical protein